LQRQRRLTAITVLLRDRYSRTTVQISMEIADLTDARVGHPLRRPEIFFDTGTCCVSCLAHVDCMLSSWWRSATEECVKDGVLGQDDFTSGALAGGALARFSMEMSFDIGLRKL
jgi:hypothetical protein